MSRRCAHISPITSWTSLRRTEHCLASFLDFILANVDFVRNAFEQIDLRFKVNTY